MLCTAFEGQPTRVVQESTTLTTKPGAPPRWINHTYLTCTLPKSNKQQTNKKHFKRRSYTVYKILVINFSSFFCAGWQKWWSCRKRRSRYIWIVIVLDELIIFYNIFSLLFRAMGTLQCGMWRKAFISSTNRTSWWDKYSHLKTLFFLQDYRI